MSLWSLQKIKQTYGIDSWGNGYFNISKDGEVAIQPYGEPSRSLPIMDVIKKLRNRQITTPLILRFPQILESQVNRLHTAFNSAVEALEYQGSVQCVFPYKVNQRKEFIDELVRSGRQHKYGLEAGTKPELFAALSYELHDEALIVCNGFKDSKFVQLAFDAKRMGKNIILVIEGIDELNFILQYAKQVGFCVDIGLRAKLYAKGSGRWEKSSGAASKFGLTTVEMWQALQMIQDEGYAKNLVMVHYHIGSQIPEIRRVKKAMQEAGRVYCKIQKLGFNLKYLNIGGGIGVDYDGSKTSFYVSANYSMQEFANDVVYIIKQVCQEEEATPPTIVSESGRAVAAYHAVLVTDIREVEQMGGDVKKVEVEADDHRKLHELLETYQDINVKNYNEYYHDAISFREELLTLFNLGYIELEARAKTEILFDAICEKALYYHRITGLNQEEFSNLDKDRVGKYLANFSMFQSIPDSWSIDQLFPVMPLHNLHEKPDRKGVIMDITCDSDGCLSNFVDKKNVKKALELHTPDPKEPYYIGFFLVGAYQEALGNNHNLFGAVNEVIVHLKEDGSVDHFEEVKGEDIGELLRIMDYKDEEIIQGYQTQVDKRVQAGAITQVEADQIMEKVRSYFYEYPYLLTKPHRDILG